MKLRWKIVISFAVVLALIAIVFEHGNLRARRAVEVYRQELRARGEKLAIEELIPPTPAGPNGAEAFLNGAARFRDVFTNYPPIMNLVAPGHALAISRLETLPTAETSDLWPGLLRDVETDEPALSEVRDALTNQVLTFQINYQKGVAGLLPQLAGAKHAMIHLSEATVVALHRGDANRAWENLQATGRLVRLYGDEPLEICQLVRAAILQTGLDVTWEALEQGCWQEGQLAELQSDWESLELIGVLEASLEMESAKTSQTLDRARASYVALAELPTQSGLFGLADDARRLVDDPAGGFKAMMDRYPRYWRWAARESYEYELTNMKMLQGGVESVRRARNRKSFSGCPAKYSVLPWKSFDSSLFDGLYGLGDFPKVDTNSVSRLLHEIENLEVQRHLLITAIALKRFHLRHGGYPAELRELVPDFLSTLPIDWMDGKPLRYRRNADGTFLLYSVGEDGVDNGGDPTPTEPGAFQPGNTKSVSWWKARDAVWPSPATAEEVRDYMESTAKVRGKSR